MFLKWMHVENYRNLQDVEILFHQRFNYFVGENAIGKTNFLDLLQSITEGRGFQEADFLDPHKPLRIIMTMGLGTIEKRIFEMDEEEEAVGEIKLTVEQLVQEIYPRMYRWDGDEKIEIPLALMRRILYISHRDASVSDLQAIPDSVYHELGKAIEKILPEKGEESKFSKDTLHLIHQSNYVATTYYETVQNLVDLLEFYNPKEGYLKYTPNNIKLVTSISLKLLARIFMRFQSVAVNMESSVIVDKDGKRYLPLFLSVDEPEMHVSPYMQRSILTYYRQIINNESEAFLGALKKLFNVDGLLGQLFIVTHSTDSLVDDYRHIIRFYRNLEGHVKASCGVNFNFSKELEKHLIMHFPEAKEALYARCIIIVEGETEYGCFKGFGQSLGVNFDYYGICLINARGEASIGKLAKLFKRFEIPTISLYDKDVEEKYDKGDHVFFTDQTCYELDLVDYLLTHRKRKQLDTIVAEVSGSEKESVSRDMLRKGLNKLGIQKPNANPRQLKNISDRQMQDLIIYYFSWFYSNKGVTVGRQIAETLAVEDIPPAFIKVIRCAQQLALQRNVERGY